MIEKVKVLSGNVTTRIFTLSFTSDNVTHLDVTAFTVLTGASLGGSGTKLNTGNNITLATSAGTLNFRMYGRNTTHDAGTASFWIRFGFYF